MHLLTVVLALVAAVAAMAGAIGAEASGASAATAGVTSSGSDASFVYDYDALLTAHADDGPTLHPEAAFPQAHTGREAAELPAIAADGAATTHVLLTGTPSRPGSYANWGDEISDGARMVDQPFAGGVCFRSDTSHIFRDAPGHLVADTAANRSLISSAVSPNYLVSTRSVGGLTLSSYQRLLPDGRQVWVEVRNGVEITNGGVNLVPR